MQESKSYNVTYIYVYQGMTYSLLVSVWHGAKCDSFAPAFAFAPQVDGPPHSEFRLVGGQTTRVRHALDALARRRRTDDGDCHDHDRLDRL